MNDELKNYILHYKIHNYSNEYVLMRFDKQPLLHLVKTRSSQNYSLCNSDFKDSSWRYYFNEDICKFPTCNLCSRIYNLRLLL